MTRPSWLVLAGGLSLLFRASPAFALPTMIRLGYTGCASCHYSPQGGGLLIPYGRTIDEAQSLRAGEYRPRDNKIVRALSWHGRIAQDLRVVFPAQRTWAAHEPSETSFRPRLFYRNVTGLPRHFDVQLTIVAETDPVPRPTLAYDPPAESSSAMVNVALLRYHVTPAVELSGGRDQLPRGINIPDPGVFIKSRNRSGYYDTPTQVRVHWAGKRHRLTPFAYGPAGNEPDGEEESGGGALAEFDGFGNRAVFGMTFLRGRSDNGTRQMGGAHVRLGFGAWGILAEHDITDRAPESLDDSFRQHTTYGQVFWAAREWLVASAIGERLSVQQPFEEGRIAGAIELTARLTSVATAGVTARVQRDRLTRRASRSLMFQLALKTVY